MQTKDEKYYINNHLSFIVSYHQSEELGYGRIVGFEAKAFSLAMCDPNAKGLITSSDPPQEVADKKDIFFTYDVEFRESDVKWTSRWDTYLLTTDDQIPWFPIMYSLMNVLLMSGIMAAAMLGTLYRYISNLNQLESLEAQDETGWKLIHTDVFQHPVNSELLCVYVGTGVQFFGMIVLTIVSGLLGFLSSSNTGGLMTDIVLLWSLMGIFGGFAMARLYKTFQGSEWIKTTLKTACMFPGLVFCIIFVLDVVIWSEGSWRGMPFGNMFDLVSLWFGLSIPLVFIGSYIGFKQPEIKYPVKTNEIPREIPEQRSYKSLVLAIMIGGIIPAGAVFNNLFLTFTTIAFHQFYYMFGMVIVVLIIICVEVTIMMCYFHLCGEDYRWWWRSFLTSGSLGFYFFLYATFYFFTKLNITELVPGILYFGYMLVASCALFVLMGTIGFFSCFWFTRLIYSSVKIV
ncbi:transmembrane 9 superfamily member 10-like [Bidens hawaiensis]|uniref:transmembrane 9 superfamily member 10-like n=1 Tax=Bidens hawaiensis TaxID=980011 RepID=UPI004049D14C